MSKNDKHVRLHIASSVFEAQQVQQLLNEAGIENSIVSYSDTALDGLFQVSKGYGEIQVSETRKEEARKVLDEGLAGIQEVNQQKLEAEATKATPAPETGQPGSNAWLWKVLGPVAVLLIVYLLYQLLSD